MFRSATTRIAHNATLPGLSTINKDLKALQELINAEKSVMQTLQKLSADIAKAADCLKLWGHGEGDDLGDTLTASTALLLHFASALSRFSSHEAKVREQMKAIRTREENLDEVKRRRKALANKADAADKKLSKMSAENKNFQSQADSLNRLREEIRTMDAEVLNEEASLGDFKRSSTKHWMGTKFGALLECSTKGTLVGEMGKVIIEEILLIPTEPGLPRPYYQGHARTEFVVAEAQRAIDEVHFSTDPGQRPHSMSIRPLPGSELPPISGPQGMLTPMATGSAYTPSASTPSVAEAPSDMFKRQSQVYMSPGQQLNALPPIRSATDDSFGMQSYLANDNGAPAPPTSPPMSPHGSQAFGSLPLAPLPEVNEFGAYPATSSQFAPRSTSLRNLGPSADSSAPASPVGGPRGPRFATFPTKLAAAPVPPRFQNLQAGSPPSLYAAPQGLGERGPSLDLERRESLSFSSSIAQALGEEWDDSNQGTPQPGQPTNPKLQSPSNGSQEQWTLPPPRYSITPDHPSGSNDKPREDTLTDTTDDDDAQLAYAASDSGDRNSRSSALLAPQGSRHVRFGDGSEEAEPHQQPSDSASQDRAAIPYQVTTYDDVGELAPQHEASHPSTSPPRSPHDHPEPSAIPSSLPTDHADGPLLRMPEPEDIPPPPMTKDEEERALNAATAREISREMDALMFTGITPPRHSNGQTATASQPPSSPHMSLPLRGRPSYGQDLPSSPPLGAQELGYVRQRDRAASIPVSPTSTSENHHPLPIPPSVNSMNETPSSPSNNNHPLPPPPPISLRGTSPAQSFSSVDSPYRTPSEFPLPAPSFYNLPSASGSGSLSPGGARTISAAIFKRQLRNPSSPVVEPTQSSLDVSPLVINKRALPSSPRPSSNLAAVDGPGTPRMSSAPYPGATPGADSYLDARNRSGSAAAGPQSFAPSGAQGEDDEYDYISAYVDDDNGPSQDAHRGLGPGAGAGYAQGRYTTNVEQHDNR